MSGPKYVEFDVDCNEDERLEIIRMLNKARENGRANGVTYSGYGNLNIRVDNYSSMSVDQIKAMVAQAKQEAALNKERQRQEELKRAKDAETKRIKEIQNNVESQAKAQLNLIDAAIKDCEKQIVALKTTTTGTKNIKQVTAEGMAKTVESDINNLRQTKEDIEKEKQQKISSLKQHEYQIQSHATIESLNQSIVKSPSGYLSTTYNADVKQSIINKIEGCKKTFRAFTDYLRKLDGNLGADDSFAGLIRKLNITIENSKIETIDDISNCINEIKKHCQSFAEEQRAEQMRKITSFIAELEKMIESIKFTTGGSVNAGNGVNYRQQIAKHCEEIEEKVKSIRSLEHVEPVNEKRLSDMLTQIEFQKNSGYNALTEGAIRKSKQDIGMLEVNCRKENELYQKFKETEEQYKKSQQRAKAAGVDVGIEYIFGINTCKTSIEAMNRKMIEQKKEISIVTRDGRACQIIASLVNKENGKAGQYQILSDEIVNGDKRCLRFTKPGSFGVVYEYIVEPDGNAKRDVRGVKLNGDAIIREDELIEKKHNDCTDMAYLQADMEKMGSDMKFTELKTPEESSGKEEYLELDYKLIERYIAQSLEEEELYLSDEIVASVKDGVAYEQAAKNARYNHQASQTAKQTLSKKTN